jgi:hypothetical protein
MSDSNDPKPNAPAGTPVPDLIEQYRTRRDAWIAQADELARLRDEVRGSAEREAMEIVTAARRDVRQIVMEARRELLVLSAQVQAALGEAGARPDPTVLLNRARETDEEDEDDEFSKVAIFAPEEAVKGMLEDARANMEALAEDARTVPFQALTETATLPHRPEPQVMFSEDALLDVAPSPEVPPSSAHDSSRLETPTVMSPAASRSFLSSPFPTDSVPVPSNNRTLMFVALFGAAGIAILVGTIWWMQSGREPAATETARTTPPVTTSAPADSTSDASTTPRPASAAPSSPSTVPSSVLSLLVEARRSSWLRTTVDGQSDTGRMLAQGETVRLNAKQSVSLRVGDAGAVYVSVNNGQPAPLGRDGEVITRQFVAESNTGPRPAVAAAQPAQAPAPTPPPGVPVQRTSPLPPQIAAGPSPAPAIGSPPNPLPLVQPVAATPPTPTFEPPPAPPARAEATAPPSPAPRPELPNPGTASPVAAVVAASRQWLDAYHRQDRATMSALQAEGVQLADERRTEERFPSNVAVNRTLDRISVQIAADTAVLTAVMTERSADNVLPPRVSPVSQVWELRGNQWRVKQVRLVSEARLNQIFR